LEKFIKEKYAIQDNKAVIVVVNASLGLQILTKSLSIYNNQTINWSTQSFTFPPSNQGSLHESLILDIDLNGGLDLREVGSHINGLIVTNIFGNIVDIEKYTAFSKKNNKYLIFDNAATHYTFYKGKNCLNYGDGSVISFHHTKPFGFGEGGAIIVEKKYEDTIRKLINFGINLYSEKYYTKEGNNCKMSDISAVYIIQYLEDHFDIIITKHQELYNYFKKKLTMLESKVALFTSFHDEDKICPSCLCILFSDPNKSLEIEKVMLENNIFSRKYYTPLKETKNTIDIYDKILCLPCNIDMTFNDIDNMLELIKENL
jgi:dTDP-4-amino-4,6-dideoxygalactose transaminase